MRELKKRLIRHAIIILAAFAVLVPASYASTPGPQYTPPSPGASHSAAFSSEALTLKNKQTTQTSGASIAQDNTIDTARKKTKQCVQQRLAPAGEQIYHCCNAGLTDTDKFDEKNNTIIRVKNYAHGAFFTQDCQVGGEKNFCMSGAFADPSYWSGCTGAPSASEVENFKKAKEEEAQKKASEGIIDNNNCISTGPAPNNIWKCCNSATAKAGKAPAPHTGNIEIVANGASLPHTCKGDEKIWCNVGTGGGWTQICSATRVPSKAECNAKGQYLSDYYKDCQSCEAGKVLNQQGTECVLNMYVDGSCDCGNANVANATKCVYNSTMTCEASTCKPDFKLVNGKCESTPCECSKQKDKNAKKCFTSGKQCLIEECNFGFNVNTNNTACIRPGESFMAESEVPKSAADCPADQVFMKIGDGGMCVTKEECENDMFAECVQGTKLAAATPLLSSIKPADNPDPERCIIDPKNPDAFWCCGSSKVTANSADGKVQAVPENFGLTTSECPNQGRKFCIIATGWTECRGTINETKPELLDLTKHKLTDASRWIGTEGDVNTKRMVVDSVAGVAFGALGGFVVNKLMTSSQLDSGFEKVECTIGGTAVASWSDSFTIGAR